MRQRPAEQFDGAGVDQLTQQGTTAVAPRHREFVESAPGLLVLANSEGAHSLRLGVRAFVRRGRAPRGRLACAQLPIGHPVLHSGQAVRVVELSGDDGSHPEGDEVLPAFGGQGAQDAHQWQIGGRPRLVEPLLADRPPAVVRQPRQVGVQHEGEEAGR